MHSGKASGWAGLQFGGSPAANWIRREWTEQTEILAYVRQRKSTAHRSGRCSEQFQARFDRLKSTDSRHSKRPNFGLDITALRGRGERGISESVVMGKVCHRTPPAIARLLS